MTFNYLTPRLLSSLTLQLILQTLNPVILVQHLTSKEFTLFYTVSPAVCVSEYLRLSKSKVWHNKSLKIFISYNFDDNFDLFSTLIHSFFPAEMVLCTWTDETIAQTHTFSLTSPALITHTHFVGLKRWYALPCFYFEKPSLSKKMSVWSQQSTGG